MRAGNHPFSGVPGRSRDPGLHRHPPRRPPPRLRLLQGGDPEHRRPAARLDTLRERLQPVSADPPLAPVDADGPAPGGARRADEPRLPLRRKRAPDAGPDPPDARLRHGGRRVELRAARHDRHRRLHGLLRRFRGRRRGVDARREPAEAARRRDGSPRHGLGREREVEAVLPLRAHLRAASSLRAARAVPPPLRSDLRRRGRGGRRRRRGAGRPAQARRPLRPRDRPPGLRPRGRARGPRRAGARDPALPRGPPRAAPAEASGLARRRNAPGGARRADRHRADDHVATEARGRAGKGSLPPGPGPSGNGSAPGDLQRDVLSPDPFRVEPVALARERPASLHRRAEAGALRRSLAIPGRSPTPSWPTAGSRGP